MESKEYFQKQFDTVRCHPEERQSRDEGSPNAIRSFANAQDDKKNIAILLVNFGGPRNLNEVGSFLFNLFSDPKVLDFPFAFFYRKPLAWVIANLRTFGSKRMYEKISVSSSQIEITCLQKEELQKLFNRNELLIDVFVGFRYSKPFIEEVLDEIVEKGYKKLVVLPLYPQFSYTTIGSVQLVIDRWLKKKQSCKTRHCEEPPRFARGKLRDEAISKRYEIASPSARNDIECYLIKEWYKDNDYIHSFVNLIRQAFSDLDLRSTEIIFSAHSIPYFNIKKGDPYEKQIKETAELIVRELNWKRKWHLSYQSKIGPIRWLEPSTDKVIKEIAKRNSNTNILVVPISFVSEHVETLFEIEILYKEIARKCGIKKFVRLEALNTNKFLIQALYNQVIDCLESNQIGIKELLLTS